MCPPYGFVCLFACFEPGTSLLPACESDAHKSDIYSPFSKRDRAALCGVERGLRQSAGAIGRAVSIPEVIVEVVGHDALYYIQPLGKAALALQTADLKVKEAGINIPQERGIYIWYP